ncbi:hypothetical protein GCM10009841_04760 [Microlunatus panaciterrae]
MVTVRPSTDTAARLGPAWCLPELEIADRRVTTYASRPVLQSALSTGPVDNPNGIVETRTGVVHWLGTKLGITSGKILETISDQGFWFGGSVDEKFSRTNSGDARFTRPELTGPRICGITHSPWG